jgi:hypothetical protein
MATRKIPCFSVRQVYAYSVEYGRCLGCWDAHDDAVACMQLAGGALLTGSWDSSVRVWTLQARACPPRLLRRSGTADSAAAGHQASAWVCPGGATTSGSPSVRACWSPAAPGVCAFSVCLPVCMHACWLGRVELLLFVRVDAANGALTAAARRADPGWTWHTPYGDQTLNRMGTKP